MKQYSTSGQITLENMSQAVWYNTWTMKKFKKYLKGDILDAGCGIGSFTKTLETYGNVWAIDTDAHCIQSTKNTAKQAHVGHGDIEKHTYFFKKKTF